MIPVGATEVLKKPLRKWFRGEYRKKLRYLALGGSDHNYFYWDDSNHSFCTKHFVGDGSSEYRIFFDNYPHVLKYEDKIALYENDESLEADKNDASNEEFFHAAFVLQVFMPISGFDVLWLPYGSDD